MWHIFKRFIWFRHISIDQIMCCCTDIRSKSSAWNSYSSWLIKNKKLIIPTVIKYCKNLGNWCMWKWLATNFQYFSNFWFDVLLVSDVVNNLQYSLFILRFVFCSSISVSVNYWCGNFNLLYVLYSIWYALFVRFWSWDLFFVCPKMRWSQLLLKHRKILQQSSSSTFATDFLTDLQIQDLYSYFAVKLENLVWVLLVSDTAT